MVCDLAGNRLCRAAAATYIRGLMSSHDPFGRPPGGGNPFPGGSPNGGRRPGRRRFSATGIAAFLMFDVIVLLVAGALFLSGAFSGDDDTGAVIIPPSEVVGAGAGAGSVDDDDDEDGARTTVVTKETGTTTIVTPAGEGDPPTAGPAPVGANATSMIRERNLRPAIADLKRLAPGKVLMLSIHPTHVSVTVKASNGDLKIASDHWDQPAQLSSTVKGAAGHRTDTVAWSTINPAAPERLVHASGATDAQVSHLVVMPAFSPWALHFKDGRQHIQADAKGKPIR